MLFGLGLMGVVLVGCGGADAPDDVAEHYLDAIQVGDYAGAKDFASQGSQAALEELASKNAPVGDRLMDFEVGDYKVSGNRAAVEYEVDGNPGVLSLVDEGNGWKVIYQANAGQGGAAEPSMAKETEAGRVAREFLEALYSGDKQTALGLSTWDSHPEIELLDYDYKREKPDVIKVLEVTEKGESGTVHYTRNGKSFYQDLVLTGKGWQVKFDRTDEEVFEDLQHGLDGMSN